MKPYLHLTNIKICTDIGISINRGINGLFGPNGSGKTTFAESLARIASRTQKASKAECALMVTIGKTSGEVVLRDQDSDDKIEWTLPDNNMTAGTGKLAGFKSTKAAVGLESLLMYNRAEDRFRFLQESLKADVTRKQFDEALKDTGITKDGLDEYWNKYVINPVTKRPDIPNANKRFEEQRKSQKGKFADLTGLNINTGDEKRAAWVPEFYDRDLEGQSEKSLIGVLAALNAERDSALQTEAVSLHDREQLEEKYKTVTAEQEALAKRESSKKSLEQNLKDLQNKLELTGEPFECDCGKLYCVQDNKPIQVQKIEDVTKGDAASIRNTIEARKKQIAEEERAIGAITKSLDEAIAAGKKLEKMPKTDGALIEKATTAVDVATKRLEAFKLHQEATRLNRAIMQSDRLVEITKPSGLQAEAMQAALSKFNDELKRLCKVAEWGTVRVNKDTSVTYDGKDYKEQASGGQKFRCRATLQYAIAAIDHSDLVVIDGIDILDDAGRWGLLNLAQELDIPCLFTCMANSKDEMPEKQEGDHFMWIGVEPEPYVPSPEMVAALKKDEKRRRELAKAEAELEAEEKAAV